MAKGTYELGEGSNAPSSRDTSFKSFMCVMLVFIAICLIIVLAATKWTKTPNQEAVKGEKPATDQTKVDSKPLVNKPPEPTNEPTKSTPLPSITETATIIQPATVEITTEITQNMKENKIANIKPKLTNELTKSTPLPPKTDTATTIVPTTVEITTKITEEKIANTKSKLKNSTLLPPTTETATTIKPTTVEITTESAQKTRANTNSKPTNKPTKLTPLPPTIETATTIEPTTDEITTENTQKKIANTNSKSTNEPTKFTPLPPTTETATTIEPTMMEITTESTQKKIANANSKPTNNPTKLTPLPPTTETATTIKPTTAETTTESTQKKIANANSKPTNEPTKLTPLPPTTETATTIEPTTAEATTASTQKKIANANSKPTNEPTKRTPLPPTTETATTIEPTTAETTIESTQKKIANANSKPTNKPIKLTPPPPTTETATTIEPTMMEITTESTQKEIANTNSNPTNKPTKLTPLPPTTETATTLEPTTEEITTESTQKNIANTNSKPTNEQTKFTPLPPTTETATTIEPTTDEITTENTQKKIANTNSKSTNEPTKFTPLPPTTEIATTIEPTMMEITTESTQKKIANGNSKPTNEPTKLTPPPPTTETATTIEPTTVEITTESTQTTKENKIANKKPLRFDRTRHSTLQVRESKPPCHSVECKSAASRMLSFMNHSVDACPDFYEFACGGMQTDTGDSDTWERLSEQLYLINTTAPLYLQTFKSFYNSCVSHEYEFNYQKRIDGVKNLVKGVGDILYEEPPTDTRDILTDLFTKLILRQSLPFMDIGIDVYNDIGNKNSRFILKLSLPKPTSILKESGHGSALTEVQQRCLDEQRHKFKQLILDENESYPACQKNHAIYLNSIQTVVQALGFYSNLNNPSKESQQIEDLKTTIDNLNAVLSPLSPIKQTVLLKNYTTLILELHDQYPHVEWNKLFHNLTGRRLDDSTIVDFPPYFSSIFKKLEEVDSWKLNNALIAMYAHNLYENLVIPQATLSRESYCLKLSSKLFQDVSSNLYMKTWPKTKMLDSQKYLTEMFDELKQNVTATLQKKPYEYRPIRGAFSKLSNTKLIFNKQEDGYNNETHLNSKYNVIMTTDFQDNVVKMFEFDRKKRYSLIEKQISTDYLWSYFLNAYDSVPILFYSNELIILTPLGMVKQASRDIPRYITMPRIGLSLTKELVRNFNPVEIQNADHKLNENTAASISFKLISDNFTGFDDQSLLPWVSTSFSKEQIFHINVAQDYCQNTDTPEFVDSEITPASLQVKNMMKNSKQFSKVFNCSLVAEESKTNYVLNN